MAVWVGASQHGNHFELKTQCAFVVSLRVAGNRKIVEYLAAHVDLCGSKLVQRDFKPALRRRRIAALAFERTQGIGRTCALAIVVSDLRIGTRLLEHRQRAFRVTRLTENLAEFDP